MTRQARIALLLSLSAMLSLAVVNPTRAQKVLAPSMPMESDQMTNIPYFTLRDGMSSTLTLNNVDGLNPTKVTVTIFNMQGRALELPPMTLAPASVTKINLADVIAREDFDSGNIEVAYRGIPMTVTCQVSIFSIDQRVSFESREDDMMDSRSPIRNGILSLPWTGAEGFLAVTNASKNKVIVQLTVGSKKEDIPLSPRDTRLVKLNEKFDRHPPLATVIKLQYSGLPGDVITTGFVLDSKNKYSSSFTMIDPLTSRSNKLAGAHFRSGRPNPSEGFPDGTEFLSPLLLANVSVAPITAHVSVGYTVEEKLEMTSMETHDIKAGPVTRDKFSHLAVMDVTIAPGAVQRIELSEELARLGVSVPIKEAGVDIAYDAAPGTVIGHLVSVDQSGDYSFEVPIKDPSGVSETIESTYPWTIEDGLSSVVHLKNTTAKSANARVVLAFPEGGGYYNLDLITLEPYESMAIDIQKLKDSKKFDVIGHSFPTDATHGLLYWHQETPYSMVGRAEETNLKGGIASSFSCNSGCCDGYYTLDSLYFNVSSLSGAIGGNGALQGKENGISCHNIPFTGTNVSAYSWGSSASGVASVSGGTVTYVTAGTATITGTYELHGYYFDGSGVCQDLYPDPGYTMPTTAAALSYTSIQHTYPRNPLPYTCRITSFFDAVRNSKAHHAQDVVKNGGGTSYGDAVYAMEAGTVTAVASGHGPASPGYPTCAGTGALVDYVKIRTTDGYSTIYAHVSPSVSVNDNVTAGQQIGILDNSGCQSGPHLHVARKDSSGVPVNFSIPCVNPTPTTKFDDGDVLDDISDSL